MPTETIVFGSYVIAMFALFSVTLFYVSSLTRDELTVEKEAGFPKRDVAGLAAAGRA